jgi:hypothetical protein
MFLKRFNIDRSIGVATSSIAPLEVNASVMQLFAMLPFQKGIQQILIDFFFVFYEISEDLVK